MDAIGIRELRQRASVYLRRVAAGETLLVRINSEVLPRAAAMDSDLRTLDAIHLATAALFGRSLRRFVCYDGRLADAAKAADWHVVSPG